MTGEARPCVFPACDKRRTAHGLCCGHYAQLRRGEVLAPLSPKRAPCLHPDIPGAMLVPLTSGHAAIIDAADAVAVSAFNWSAVKKGRAGLTMYAARTIRVGLERRHSRVSLHRFLWSRWGLPDTPEIDHRNSNGLDNRRENLRAATHSENTRNRRWSHGASGLKGVSKHGRKWCAEIRFSGRRIRLGSFESKEEAHAAYVRAAKELHGEFARAA